MEFSLPDFKVFNIVKKVSINKLHELQAGNVNTGNYRSPTFEIINFIFTVLLRKENVPFLFICVLDLHVAFTNVGLIKLSISLYPTTHSTVGTTQVWGGEGVYLHGVSIWAAP